MLKIGEHQIMRIDRETEPGLFLSNEEGDDVLLPNKYVPAEYKIWDELNVFVYLDHEERPVATLLEPFILLNSFGYLRCTTVSKIGAFLDWGLEKELFVPFAQQARPMKVGSYYIVYMYLDEKTNRLVATSKTIKYLNNDKLTVEKFDKVDIIISHITDRGANAIVNGKHKGLIYKEDIFEDIRTGDKLEGWVKKIRPDGKLDIVLQEEGYRSIEPNAQYIYDELKANDGFLALHDKSAPEDIQAQLGLSKKSFKKAIGTLYRDRKILIKEDGLHLTE
ncbi:GntR family transcriptional regulator [Dokdonia sinensis]|uniref:GntR family transcriptional regulator n=1 Tax=Dokdonia sinensis TaxID=2479847 RepID=A0A3M0GI81_9FLAO|nr:S1-like domain-containing RNA-binding protein [Dokdonia sinensis]RMB56976.1 GntR family transcriptional regulator [Dokdonia sinensis]